MTYTDKYHLCKKEENIFIMCCYLYVLPYLLI